MPSHRVHARPASADVDGDSVPTTTDPEIVAGFLEDAAHSPGGHARVVVHPRTEAEVVAVVRDARHVLPVGAQSSLTGGATPMGETVLATDRLDRVLDIGASHITVQAGVPLSGLYGDEGIAQMRRVKQALDPRWRLAPGVIFPVFPEGSGL